MCVPIPRAEGHLQSAPLTLCKLKPWYQGSEPLPGAQASLPRGLRCRPGLGRGGKRAWKLPSHPGSQAKEGGWAEHWSWSSEATLGPPGLGKQGPAQTPQSPPWGHFPASEVSGPRGTSWAHRELGASGPAGPADGAQTAHEGHGSRHGSTAGCRPGHAGRGGASTGTLPRSIWSYRWRTRGIYF